MASPDYNPGPSPLTSELTLCLWHQHHPASLQLGHKVRKDAEDSLSTTAFLGFFWGRAIFHHLHIVFFTHPSIHQSNPYLSIHQPTIHLSIHSSIHPSCHPPTIRLSSYSFTHTFIIHLSIWPSSQPNIYPHTNIYGSTHPSIYLTNYFFIHICLYPTIHPSIPSLLTSKHIEMNRRQFVP